MRRDTQNVLLVLLGGALIKIAANDTYLRYVRPGHRWWLFAAGAVILVLAVVTIVRDMRAARTCATGGGATAGGGSAGGGSAVPAHGDHGGHEHREPHSPWLLILPVLAIFLVAPPALGADSVTRASGANSVAPASVADEFDPLPAGDAPELGLSDFVARAVWDGSGELTGRDVTLTGFVVHRGGSVELARMVITCCAADARPMVVRLTGIGPDIPADSWLRVRVRLQPGSATTADGYVPNARVVDAVPTAEPSNPYEF